MSRSNTVMRLPLRTSARADARPETPAPTMAMSLIVSHSSSRTRNLVARATFRIVLRE